MGRPLMLTDGHRFLLPQHLEPDLARRLRDLADDVGRIRNGSAPSDAVLAEAPAIRDWHSEITPVGLRLIGRVSGHPRLGSTTAMTSQVWAADERGTWIQTLNRFYRLGPAGAADYREGSRHV